MKYLKYFENHNKVDVNKIVDIIKSDCKPFIEELKVCGLGVKTINNHLLYRGFKQAERYEVSPGIYQVENFGQRSPLHTSVEVSDLFDDTFEKVFGVRPRKDGFYASKSKSVSQDYGESYLLFPIGEYRYFWNTEVDDFYTHIRDLDWYMDLFEYPDGSLIEINYDRIYGPGGAGFWMFDSIELSDGLSHSVKMAKLEFPQLSKKSDEVVKNLLYWKPELSEDEYRKYTEEQMKIDIESIVSGYTDSGYQKVFHQEIMFLGNSYYLVDANLIDDILSIL
jgi:hypothetical protein